jgi:hypothetical protein
MKLNILYESTRPKLMVWATFSGSSGAIWVNGFSDGAFLIVVYVHNSDPGAWTGALGRLEQKMVLIKNDIALTGPDVVFSDYLKAIDDRGKREWTSVPTHQKEEIAKTCEKAVKLACQELKDEGMDPPKRGVLTGLVIRHRPFRREPPIAV